MLKSDMDNINMIYVSNVHKDDDVYLKNIQCDEMRQV